MRACIRGNDPWNASGNPGFLGRGRRILLVHGRRSGRRPSALGLVCVLLAEATTIGAVIYFTLRTLTGRHLAQSTRLMDHKSNS